MALLILEHKLWGLPGVRCEATAPAAPPPTTHPPQPHPNPHTAPTTPHHANPPKPHPHTPTSTPPPPPPPRSRAAPGCIIVSCSAFLLLLLERGGARWLEALFGTIIGSASPRLCLPWGVRACVLARRDVRCCCHKTTTRRLCLLCLLCWLPGLEAAWAACSLLCAVLSAAPAGKETHPHSPSPLPPRPSGSLQLRPWQWPSTSSAPACPPRRWRWVSRRRAGQPAWRAVRRLPCAAGAWAALVAVPGEGQAADSPAQMHPLEGTLAGAAAHAGAAALAAVYTDRTDRGPCDSQRRRRRPAPGRRCGSALAAESVSAPPWPAHPTRRPVPSHAAIQRHSASGGRAGRARHALQPLLCLGHRAEQVGGEREPPGSLARLAG